MAKNISLKSPIKTDVTHLNDILPRNNQGGLG